MNRKYFYIITFLEVITLFFIKLSSANAFDSNPLKNNNCILSLNEINLLLESDSSQIFMISESENPTSDNSTLSNFYDNNKQIYETLDIYSNTNEYLEMLDLKDELVNSDENSEFDINKLLENENEILENNQYNKN